MKQIAVNKVLLDIKANVAIFESLELYVNFIYLVDIEIKNKNRQFLIIPRDFDIIALKQLDLENACLEDLTLFHCMNSSLDFQTLEKNNFFIKNNRKEYKVLSLEIGERELIKFIEIYNFDLKNFFDGDDKKIKFYQVKIKF